MDKDLKVTMTAIGGAIVGAFIAMAIWATLSTISNRNACEDFSKMRPEVPTFYSRSTGCLYKPATSTYWMKL
jgi:hypothetical protein